MANKTAGMVQAKIVKAGGAGVAGAISADCAAVFAQFDPPIVCGTYDQVRAANAAADNGCQAEHAVPNGCFQSSRGDSATNVLGPDGNPINYSEEEGFCYNAYDDQSQGTEHKFLTDAERAFSQENALEGEQATLGEWLDKMEGETAEMLASDKAHSAPGARDRIKDAQHKTPEQKKALAAKAAKCLRMAAEAHYQARGVSSDTVLRNPWRPTKAQIAAKLEETGEEM